MDNFDVLTLACPIEDGPVPADFLPVDDPRIKVVALPAAHTPHRFAFEILKMHRSLAYVIDNSVYLHFAIGGLFGDWGSVCALIAHGKGRQFAVWTDRVESQVAAHQARLRKGPKRFYYTAIAYLEKFYEREIIKRSALGLFHGMDCFEAYSPFSSNPHLVHNIHLGKESHSTDAELQERLRYSGPLRIVYAGRAHSDKGIYDWIEALSELQSSGFEFRATWIGDGPELENVRRLVSQTSPSLPIRFVGSVEHANAIRMLRSSDIFMFCHKTPESPRCLIEALICGLPFVGYDAPYPRNLIGKNGGGILVPQDPKTLACAVRSAAEQRKELTFKARMDGAHFDATSVFRHRSELMKSVGRAQSIEFVDQRNRHVG